LNDCANQKEEQEHPDQTHPLQYSKHLMGRGFNKVNCQEVLLVSTGMKLIVKKEQVIGSPANRGMWAVYVAAGDIRSAGISFKNVAHLCHVGGYAKKGFIITFFFSAVSSLVQSRKSAVVPVCCKVLAGEPLDTCVQKHFSVFPV